MAKGAGRELPLKPKDITPIEAKSLEKTENEKDEDFIKSFELSPDQRKKLHSYLEKFRDKKSCPIYITGTLDESLPKEIEKSEHVKELAKTVFYKSIVEEGGSGSGRWQEYMEEFGIEESFFKQDAFKPYKKERWMDRIQNGMYVEAFRTNIKSDDSESNKKKKEQEIKEEDLSYGAAEEIGLDLNSPEVKAIAIQGMGGYIQRNIPFVINMPEIASSVDNYKKFFNISEEEFTKTILEGVKKEILGDKYSYFHTEEIDKLRSQYPFVETFLNSKEAEELAKIRAKKDMIKGEESPDIVKYFSISADELNQSKIKEDRRKTSLKELEKQIEEKENPDFIFYKIERTNDVLSKEDWVDIFKKYGDSDNFIKGISYGFRYEIEKNIVLFSKIGVPEDLIKKASKSFISARIGYSERVKAEELENIRGLIGLSDDEFKEAVTLGIVLDMCRRINEYEINDLQDKLGLEKMSDSPEIQEKLKEAYLKKIEGVDTYDLKFIDEKFEIKWNPTDRPVKKEAVKKALIDRLYGFRSMEDIRDFIDSYYPETHKLWLIADPEVCSAVEKHLVSLPFSNSTNMIDKNIITEACRYFNVSKEKVLDKIKKRIIEGELLANSREGWRLERFAPEIDLKKENIKALEANRAKIINNALETKNWGELKKIQETGDESSKQEIQNILNTQKKNLTDKTKSPYLRLFAVESIAGLSGGIEYIENNYFQDLVEIYTGADTKNLLHLFRVKSDMFNALDEKTRENAFNSLIADSKNESINEIIRRDSIAFLTEEQMQNVLRNSYYFPLSTIGFSEALKKNINIPSYFYNTLYSRLMTENKEQINKEIAPEGFSKGLNELIIVKSNGSGTYNLLQNKAVLKSIALNPSEINKIKKVLEEIPAMFLSDNWGYIYEKLKDASDTDFEDQKDLMQTMATFTQSGLMAGNGFKPTFEKLISYSPEERNAYLEIYRSIENSPSQEIKRIRSEILDEVIKSENPVEAYKKIEDIFIKNNLPMVGKVYKVFDYLHSADKNIVEDLNKNNGSRVLINGGEQSRKNIIYRDLVKIHVESGNRSLRKFIHVINSGQKIIDKAENQGWSNLSYNELQETVFVLKKLNTLYQNAVFGKKTEPILDETAPIDQIYRQIRESLKTKDGQKISERVAEMFVRPAGFNSFADVENTSAQKKKKATERNVSFAEEATTSGEIEINSGDMLKGVDSIYLSNILQNGSVAKEFLGGSANKDCTPLDTDVSLVLQEDLRKGFISAVSSSLSNSYGDITLGFRNRGQFDDTSENKKDAKYDSNKLELFSIGGGRHYGVRTGIPSTEIDFIMIRNDGGDVRLYEKIKFEIVKNGFYIPIVNYRGKVLFEAEEYKNLRHVFDGVSEYEGGSINVNRLNPDEKGYGYIKEIMKVKEVDLEQVSNIGRILRSQVVNTLEKSGLVFRSQYDNSIFGTEFHDIGSTGRGTNLPENYDYDFGLRLDVKDSNQAGEFAEILRKNISPQANVLVQAQEGGYFQLRATGITEINGIKLEKPVDLDVGFGKKTDEVAYGSHDAVSDKLISIEKDFGPEVKSEVIANIVLAKKLLTEAGCYKKVDGGLGGIGIENWILQNGGNFKQAFASFQKSAYNENNERLSLDEMRKKYSLYDAGINIKFNNHDNFMFTLKEHQYEKMLKLIEQYLFS